MGNAQTGNTHILQTQLEEYAAQGLYPFHMPGHKRRMQPAPGLPVSCDVTELPGTDDLHDARGILRDAMRRTAALYGADRSWYLVNGSTGGLLAGIRALARPGSEVICARNCHKAVYHALELSGYRVHWIMPDMVDAWGICGGIRAQQVEAVLHRHPASRAVILTSPTYEGILSEVGPICRVCHDRGIPVLVDEAHGAHLLPASERAGFPAGAVARGADLVVQSPHKTLPSLTQTALLHLQGSRVDPVRVEEQLDVFLSSSPSYPLMVSLDGCTGILREQGEELFEKWALRIGRFDDAVRSLHRIRILYHTPEAIEKAPGKAPDQTPGKAPGKSSWKAPENAPENEPESAPGTAPQEAPLQRILHRGQHTQWVHALYDPGKILIDAGPAGRTGEELASILRDRYRMETEMQCGTMVLAMTGLCDGEDALDRLAAALLEIDADSSGPEKTSGTGTGRDTCGDPETDAGLMALYARCPAAACTPAEAAGQESEEVPVSEAQGRICAEYLYFYPPGIPVLAPGEIVGEELAGALLRSAAEGIFPYRRGKSTGTLQIRCLRE